MTELDYRLILDAFADAVVAADGKNRIVYLNAAAEKLLGWSAGELVGRPLVTIIPPRLHPAHHAGFNRYIATHVPKLIGHAVRAGSTPRRERSRRRAYLGGFPARRRTGLDRWLTP